MYIPLKFAAGDTIQWDDYETADVFGNSIRSADFDLTYYLRGPSKLDVIADAEGTGWRTTITAEESAELTPGKYTWSARVTDDSDNVYTLGTGQLEITANIESQIAGYDGRTQARIDYDNVLSAIRTAITSGGVAEYTIGNRSARKYPLADLIILRDKLKLEVIREEKKEMIASGLGDPSNIYTRFRSSSR